MANSGKGGGPDSGGPDGGPGGGSGGGLGGGGNRGRTPLPNLLWKFKKAQQHFVEGQSPLLRYGEYGGEEMVSNAEFSRRTRAQETQQAAHDAELALRKKIKPIKETDVSVARKRATRRKQRGRTGTLLSETLG